MNDFETRHFDLKTEVRSKADGTRTIHGQAIVFNRDSEWLGFVERIAPEAVTRSLNNAASGEHNIFALWSHDSAQPLGSTRGGKLALEADGFGVNFDLDPARFTPAQLDAVADGEVRMSFGFRVIKDQWERLEDGRDLRTVLDMEFNEISFVINPAYAETSAALRSLEQFRTTLVAQTEAPTVDESSEDKYSARGTRLRLMKRWLDQKLRD